MRNMNLNEGDLVYVELCKDYSPPISAISRLIKEVYVDDESGMFDKLYALDTQLHGIVYVDANSSNLKKYNFSSQAK
jgi:hypothetical protein